MIPFVLSVFFSLSAICLFAIGVRLSLQGKHGRSLFMIGFFPLALGVIYCRNIWVAAGSPHAFYSWLFVDPRWVIYATSVAAIVALWGFLMLLGDDINHNLMGKNKPNSER